MIIELLNQSIQEMRQLREQEELSNDTKEQERIESNFKTIVGEFYNILKQMNMACKKCEFKPSEDTKKHACTILEELEKCLQGSISELKNAELSKERKKLTDELKVEWEEFYREETTVSVNLLNTVKEITTERSKAETVLVRIKNGATWIQDERTMELFVDGLVEAERIIKALKLESLQILFLRKVAQGTATIDDLNESVLDWIRKNELGGKLSIKFNANN